MGLAALVATVLLPRIPQDPAYHELADTRVVWGIGRFGDVVTNIPYMIVGVLGLRFLVRVRRSRHVRPFRDPKEAWTYAAFFAGVGLTGLGSAWYHWAPGTDSLMWDRLAMVVAFMGLFSAVIGDRVGPRVGVCLLPVLLAAGLASVVYWYLSECLGAGDLRFYSFVQFYPAMGIPLMMLLFPPRYTHARWLWGTIGWYALAKAVEHLDRPIFELTGVVSGHNLKHLFAALAGGWLLLMLQRRRPK